MCACSRAAHAAGNLTLDLLSTGGGACDSTPLALCLSSFRIDVDASCNVGITPLLASNVYVPGIWSSNSAGTYTRLVACPTWAREAVSPAGGSSATPAQMTAAIKSAIEQHVYGSDYPLSLSSVTWIADGQVSLATTIPGSCTLKYAITQVREWGVEWTGACAGWVACLHCCRCVTSPAGCAQEIPQLSILFNQCSVLLLHVACR